MCRRGLAAVLVPLALAGCSSTAADPAQVTVQSAEGRAGSTELLLTVDSCHQDPSARVEETPTAVRVTVTVDRGGNGDDCADGVRVELSAPLGSREVHDVVAGRAVPLRR